jgi:hypothetical protein
MKNKNIDLFSTPPKKNTKREANTGRKTEDNQEDNQSYISELSCIKNNYDEIEPSDSKKLRTFESVPSTISNNDNTLFTKAITNKLLWLIKFQLQTHFSSAMNNYIKHLNYTNCRELPFWYKNIPSRSHFDTLRYCILTVYTIALRFANKDLGYITMGLINLTSIAMLMPALILREGNICFTAKHPTYSAKYCKSDTNFIIIQRLCDIAYCATSLFLINKSKISESKISSSILHSTTSKIISNKLVRDAITFTSHYILPAITYIMYIGFMEMSAGAISLNITRELIGLQESINSESNINININSILQSIDFSQQSIK